MTVMAMNGEMDYVTRLDFDATVARLRAADDELSEEQGKVHGLIANFLKDQKARDERRDKMFADQLERLRMDFGGEVRKTQDSLHEVEEISTVTRLELVATKNEAVVARNESLHRELAETKADHRALKVWVGRIVLTLLSAAGGGTVWEAVRSFIHK